MRRNWRWRNHFISSTRPTQTVHPSDCTTAFCYVLDSCACVTIEIWDCEWRLRRLEMHRSQVQILMVVLFSSELLAQVSGAPRRDGLTDILRSSELADNKVRSGVVSSTFWNGKKKEENVWFHVMFFIDSFLLLPSVRISLTCSCSSFSLNWWRPKRARCSPDLQRWRRRRWESGRWYGDTFSSPKESARQAAAASSGRPSHHADTTSQRLEWEFHLTLTW